MSLLVEFCLIADDHAMMRDALAGTVRLIWPDADIRTAANFSEAVAAASSQRFDLILCDLSMPGPSPLEGVAQIMAAAPGTSLLIVTGSEDDAMLLALLAMGVSGFLTKTASGEVVEAAIALVAAGGRYLPPRLLDLVSPGLQRPTPPSPVVLTERQQHVLSLLVKGASNKEIARMLAISPATVKVHVAAVLLALRARNRAEAIARAFDRGLVQA
jgi:two-component system, NarL family, nitrate/nitrite response regulator NarL